MQKVVISGGTGIIGSAISVKLFNRGYEVFALTRDYEKNGVRESGITYSFWDVAKEEVDKKLLYSADYIIHLAGAGVADKRWTKKRKQEIVDSRVKSGLLLTKVLLAYPNNLKAFVSASAIGWYGPDPEIPNPNPFTETAPAAPDYLGTTCKQWEQSTWQLKTLDRRAVYLRTGIVLNNSKGALREFIKPLKFKTAAILGSGKQVVSWIHIDDLVNLYIEAIENETLDGIYNAVAPHPVSNKELTLALARQLNGGFFIKVHVPVFALKLVLGEMSVEVLKSTTVSSEKIRDTGFGFLYPNIDAALKNLEHNVT